MSHQNFSHGSYANREQESWCIEFRMMNNYSIIVESLWGVFFIPMQVLWPDTIFITKHRRNVTPTRAAAIEDLQILFPYES
jgi:hypothetical protein